MSPYLSERATTEPDLTQLEQDFSWCVNDRDARVFDRLNEAIKTRACWWEGQTPDGRKWWKREGESDVFPWKGAADSRVHLTDFYVRKSVSQLMAVWRRNTLKVQGTEANDGDWATRTTELLRWIQRTQIDGADAQARYAANLFAERGAVVIGVHWIKEAQLGYEVIEREKLQELALAAQQLAVSGDPRQIIPGKPNELIATIIELIDDPTREKDAIELALDLFPDSKRPSLAKGIKQLRAGKPARVVRKFDGRNCPTLCAFALNEDIFLPPDVTDIDENCPSVHFVERIPETVMRDRVKSMGWDEDWVEAVVNTQRGNVMLSSQSRVIRNSAVSLRGKMTTSGKRLFEIIHTYRRQYDENDVPAIYYTVWHKGQKASKSGKYPNQGYGIHELIPYDHGKYPFTLIRREARSKIPDESRGVPEIGGTWQQAIKAEWDGRRDRTSIALIPPSYYPPGQPPPEWGPAAMVPTGQPDRYGFFKAPTYDPGSKEIEATVQRFADRYFGSVLDDGSNAQEAGLLNQDEADAWMDGWKRVYTQVLKLAQQYMPDEFFFRVVGSDKAKPIHATRKDIQGQFDLTITFDIDNLNDESTAKKIELIRETVAMDTKGVIDQVEALKVIYELIDPNLGERLLRPAAEAFAAEIDDEGTAFAKMWAGIDTEVHPNGQNYEARLQWLGQMFQQNAQAQERYTKDPQFKELLDKRVKQLKFQYDQHVTNPQIGKRGA